MNQLFYNSVTQASIESLRWMIDHGAEPASIGAPEGVPLLHKAAQTPNAARLEFLLGLGIDARQRGPNGNTVLHTAAASGVDEHVLRIMLAKGLKVNDTNAAGQQPIHLANVKSIDVLVRNGAEVDAVDGLGRTALHQAASVNRADLVVELLRVGASVFKTDSKGRTPLHLAALARAEPVVDALLAAGGPTQRARCRRADRARPGAGAILVVAQFRSLPRPGRQALGPRPRRLSWGHACTHRVGPFVRVPRPRPAGAGVDRLAHRAPGRPGAGAGRVARHLPRALAAAAVLAGGARGAAAAALVHAAGGHPQPGDHPHRAGHRAELRAVAVRAGDGGARPGARADPHDGGLRRGAACHRADGRRTGAGPPAGPPGAPARPR